MDFAGLAGIICAVSGTGQFMRTPRVLIVEDSPEMADLLAISLQADNIGSDGADSGAKALELAKSKPFDLVLLDLGLPDMDGLDVLAALKADAALKPIPVIVITGRERTEDKLRAFNLGAVDYVNKPFNLDEVVLLVEKALETSHLRREVRALRGTQHKDFSIDSIIKSPQSSIMEYVPTNVPATF